MARCPLIAVSRAVQAIESRYDLEKMGFMETVYCSTVRDSPLPDIGKMNHIWKEKIAGAVLPEEVVSGTS